jgi:tetratricopeptide (TPR) repeat protein
VTPERAVDREQVARAYEQVVLMALAGAADRAVVVGRQLAVDATALGDEAAVVRLRHAVAIALGHLRQYDAALTELAEADRLAGRSGNRSAQAVIWSTAAWTEVCAGRHEEGLRTLARAHATLEAEPVGLDSVVAASNLALSATQLGLLELAERWFAYAGENLAILPAGTRRSAHYGNHSVLEFEWALKLEHAGRPLQARERYRRCRALGVLIGAAAGEGAEGAPWRIVARANDGICAAKLGEHELALTHFDAVMDDVDTQTILITRCAAHLGAAWAWVGVGDTGAATAHGEQASRLANALGYARWEADAHRALACAAGRRGDAGSEGAHRARSEDLLAELEWQARLRRLGVSLGLGRH